MLISVTAPRKGMGQTLTSINIAAAITQILKEKVMLIDLNRSCSDVENYLSDTKITKGLDDFISLYNSNLLNRDSFNACVKTTQRIDIMSSNECLDFDSKTLMELLDYTKNIYKTVILDTISGKNPISHKFFEQSDYIVVVLNQSRHILDMICKSDLYKPYKGKLIFIINRFMDKYEEKKFQFGLNQIISQLKVSGYGNSVFPLAFDMDVINECNDNAILNRILNNNSEEGKYSKQLTHIVNCLLKDLDNSTSITVNKRKNSILNFFTSKGAAPYAT